MKIFSDWILFMIYKLCRVFASQCYTAKHLVSIPNAAEYKDLRKHGLSAYPLLLSECELNNMNLSYNFREQLCKGKAW